MSNTYTQSNSLALPWRALASLALLTSACGGSDCPEGRVEQNGRCVLPSDGAPDAGADATPSTDGAGGAANGTGGSGTGGGERVDSGSGGAAQNPDAGVDAAPEAAPCDSVECHDHAHCLVADGGPVCECDEGYEGDGVDSCNRNECIALGDGGAPCGDNATCDDPSAASDDFECTCEPGYAHCAGASAGADGGVAIDGGAAASTAGCETHIDSDPDSCGQCGFACAGSLGCSDAECEQVAGVLVASNNGACALLEPADDLGARDLRCWGANAADRLRNPSLGTGADSYDSVPKAVPDIGAVRDIATGGSHTCVIDDNTDTVTCWGDNGSYQLGSSDTTVSVSELVDRSIPRAHALALGIGYSCVLLSDGSVDCWGTNAGGELGKDPADTSSSVLRQTIPISNVVEISASYGMTCARTEAGQVGCWGVPASYSPQYLSKDGVQLSDAVQVDVGTTGFVCARREGGTVVCWGSNSYGQLGNSSFQETSTLDDFITVEGLTDVVDVTAGAYHACALDESGRVWCWGSTNQGELRDVLHADTTADDPVRSPAQVKDLTDVIDIEAGWDFTCARKRSGQVVCWGVNNLGQLGDGTAVTPGPANAIRNVRGLP